MPSPELTHTGQKLYDALAPLAENDADQGYALAIFCGVDPISVKSPATRASWPAASHWGPC